MTGCAISVVVIAYRQRQALAEALQSCVDAASAVPGGAELIVVDNGDLAPYIRDGWPSVRLIEPAANVGFAGGVQLGVAAAGAKWIALVNDDARVERDALALLLAAGERNERIGSVAGQVRFHSDPTIVNSAGLEVDSLGIAAERLAGRPATDAQRSCEIFGPSGCFALYRMAMLEAVGGFDERYFAYLEDIDLAWRARACGWIAVYEPLAIAYHRGSASTGEGSPRKYYLVGRNRVRLLARNATTAQLVRGFTGMLLYDLAYIVYAGLTDRTLAPVRGRLAGLREWRALRLETRAIRAPVKLGPARSGWLMALRQHRAYRASS